MKPRRCFDIRIPILCVAGLVLAVLLWGQLLTSFDPLSHWHEAPQWTRYLNRAIPQSSAHFGAIRDLHHADLRS